MILQYFFVQLHCGYLVCSGYFYRVITADGYLFLHQVLPILCFDFTQTEVNVI